MAGLVRTRRECGEIGSGQWSSFPTRNDAVLGLQHEADDTCLVIVNNLSGTPQRTELPILPEDFEKTTELFADSSYPDVDGTQMTLRPFGFRWLRVRGVY
jgi:hypothetical protein